MSSRIRPLVAWAAALLVLSLSLAGPLMSGHPGQGMRAVICADGVQKTVYLDESGAPVEAPEADGDCLHCVCHLNSLAPSERAPFSRTLTAVDLAPCHWQPLLADLHPPIKRCARGPPGSAEQFCEITAASRLCWFHERASAVTRIRPDLLPLPTNELTI